MKRLFIFFLALLLTLGGIAQTIDPSILNKTWKATWISYPEEASTEYGVYHFRKVLSMTENPQSYVVHVTGDNHYKLFVNGQLVSIGPTVSDLNHWKYETIDLAPYLQTGKNVLYATVWNEGNLKAFSQFSSSTAFLLQGNTSKEYDFNTNTSWLCVKDSAYTPLVQTPKGYYAAEPGDKVDQNLTSDSWMQPENDPLSWKKAQYVAPAIPKGVYSMFYSPWMLEPSGLPQAERTSLRLMKTRKAQGVAIPLTFPATKGNITIAPNTQATILLDQTYLTNAYPTLTYSKGKNARVALQYAEGLFDEQMEKGNRNDIEGKSFIGRVDSLVCNGKDNQTFTPLKWRTYRYLQVSVKTAAEPLVINDLYGMFTGYPFENKTTFKTDNTLLDSILQIGWRTARLCAVESYFDCPFYEQLQYIGDTRIQMMVSYYTSGDDRLARNAINQIDASRLPEGISQSRYPSSKVQIIPPFSLLWIGMLSDFYRYRPDSEFVRSKLPAVRQLLSFFANYEQTDGSLRNVPYWNFTDWASGNSKSWKFGVAPMDKQGSSSVLDLQLLKAFQLAADLENNLGSKSLATAYLAKASTLKQTIQQKYWDSEKKLYADNAEKNNFSQHANVLAILDDVVSGQEAKELLQRVLLDETLAKASISFSYYLNQALTKAGLGDDYLNHLDIWKKNIQLGMTTWGEDSNVENTRSDCHAWGASPNVELFRTLLGIDSDAPGFSSVKVEPHLGNLAKAGGSMPHPIGTIEVQYQSDKRGKWKILVVLPDGVSGRLFWKGNVYDLKPLINQFSL